jgi:hypothetical protein
MDLDAHSTYATLWYSNVTTDGAAISKIGGRRRIVTLENINQADASLGRVTYEMMEAGCSGRTGGSEA